MSVLALVLAVKSFGTDKNNIGRTSVPAINYRVYLDLLRNGILSPAYSCIYYIDRDYKLYTVFSDRINPHTHTHTHTHTSNIDICVTQNREILETFFASRSIFIACFIFFFSPQVMDTSKAPSWTAF